MLARGHDRRRHLPQRGLLLLLAGAIPALLAPMPAGAATVPTRSEYVARAEAICKTATERHEGVLNGVEGMVKSGRLDKAADRVQGAATALSGTLDSLSALPRPPADAARISRWLGLARNGGSLLDRMVADLHRGQRGTAQRRAHQLLHEAKRANAVVVGFQFYYCRMDPARFV